jgi:hypothetical protein
MLVLENEDESDLEYNELSFEEKGEGFKWEVVEKDGETFIVVDDDTDEDFFIESEKVTDPEKTCYVYKYPRKLVHLI